jgi:hypothetical protein
MKECDKRKSHISKLYMIYISSNNVRHPVIKTFTTLHYTSSNYTSLHFTTLVDTSRTLVDTSLIEGVKVKRS